MADRIIVVGSLNDPYNKALYKMICPTLLASDYKHLKYVIEEL